ncbi:hypothetical protein [Nakamurella sp.]|uniref:hypothetical protein n=1 Tax=Nakamurella sp. TaxID=1869182 RepID=UPI003784FAB0
MNTALGEPANIFEHLCQTIAADIVQSIATVTVTGVRPFGGNYDGGVEVKVRTSDDRVFGLQSKYFSDFGKEYSAVRKSLAKMLATPSHDDVTDFVWCSANKDTTVRGEAVRRFSEAAKNSLPHGRSLEVHFRSLAAIDGILARANPELHGMYFGSGTVSRQDLTDLSSAPLRAALDRVVDEGDFDLHFRSDLERIMDRFSGTDTVADCSRLSIFVDELARRTWHVTRARRLDLGMEGIERSLRDLISVLDSPVSTPTEVESLLRHELTTTETLLSSLSSLLESLDDHYTSLDDVADRVRIESEREAILGVARSYLAIRDELAVAADLRQARSVSFLLVRGPWGTGKTYHLARHARSLAQQGIPVLFVRARAFTDSDLPVLKQSWRRGLPCADLSPRAFTTLLDYLGAGQSGPTVLIVDGINEWASPIWRHHLDELASQVAGTTHLRVIVTMRSDSHRPPDLPTYVHRSPERLALARSLNNAVGTPPGTLWSAALHNPLMARIAAKVAHTERARQPERAPGRPLLAPLSVSRLVTNWVTLLAEEFSNSATIPGATRSAALVHDIVAHITSRGGSARRSDLLTSLPGTTRSALDEALGFLCDNGLLEDEDNANEFGFRWQRVKEIHAADQLLRRGRSSVRAFLRELSDPEEFDDWIDLFAELCPPSVAAEVPHYLRGAAGRGRLIEAFSRSLQNRPTVDYLAQTRSLAAVALRDESSAWLVCFAALVNVTGLPDTVSPGWLAAELSKMSGPQREAIWPSALERCLDSVNDAKVLSDVYTWAAGRGRRDMPAESKVGLSRCLLWWSWTLSHPKVVEYAVRWITEELFESPRSVEVLIKQCIEMNDEHQFETVACAANGVRGRWPDSATAEHVCRTVLTAAEAFRPQMFRTLQELYFLTGEAAQASGSASGRPPFQDFLRAWEDPLPNPSWLRPPGTDPILLSPQELALFADGMGPSEHALLEHRLLRRAGIGAATLRRELRREREEATGRRRTCAAELYADLIRQSWYTYECGRFETGSRTWSSAAGHLKAGRPENPGLGLVSPRGAAWQFSCDASLPLILSAHRSDTVSGDWWVPTDISTLECESDLCVGDPDGVEWIVVDASLRFRDPPPDEDHLDIRIELAQTHISGVWEPRDGFPMAGSKVHLYAAIRTRVRLGIDKKATARETPGQTTFAEQMRPLGNARRDGDACYSESGELERRHTPSNCLITLLSATWTGHGVDCVADGELVVTDPSLAGRGPRALLVRRSALRSALSAQRCEAVIEVRLADINNDWGNRAHVRTISIRP